MASESDLVARKVLKPENPFLDFLKKRFMDLIDTFSFRISAGPGIRGHVRVTKLVQAGLGYMGPAEGKTLGQTFPVYKLGYLKREGGLWQERTAEIGISLFYYYQTEGKYLGGNKRQWGYEDRGFWDIGFRGWPGIRSTTCIEGAARKKNPSYPWIRGLRRTIPSLWNWMRS